MSVSTTMVRVPDGLRDRIRGVAKSRQETFAQVITHGLDLIEQELFWQEVGQIEPDDAYRREFANWDEAPLDQAVMTE